MTALRRWTLRSDPVGCDQFFWFYIFIYETKAELRRAAEKYRPNELDHSETAACFQPSFTVRIDKKGNLLRSPRTAFLGVMRLSTEELDPGIVIHECGHAAVNYLRALKLKDYVMMGRNIATEEAFCFAVQEFSHSLLKKLDYVK